MGGGLTLRIFLRSKWHLDLLVEKYFGLFQWEKIIFCQNAYFCLKMIIRPCYFYFFPYKASGEGWVFESMEIQYFFEGFPYFLNNA